ncbi:MAG: hypothetical protein N2248_00295 [candidate division WOR-3 bacterium]|nr:hypothetical protein [candidate division WOR-3 bacterium]
MNIIGFLLICIGWLGIFWWGGVLIFEMLSVLKFKADDGVAPKLMKHKIKGTLKFLGISVGVSLLGGLLMAIF